MTGLQLTSLREGREPVSHRRHITSIGAALVLAVVLSAAAACASARAVDSELAREPVLASWIDSVDRSKLEPTVDDLSGETSPLIGGSPFTILTRSSKSGVSADMVEQYVYEHLLAYGLTSVGYQSFARDGATYRNVVGEIAGTRHPQEIVVVGAHLDSKSGAQDAILAPGADDDASGVAATLYLAKVFARHRFDRTIRFVLFAGEEGGHVGSFYYADEVKAAGESIVGMVAADMLAYNAGSGVLGLHTRESGAAGQPGDRAIAQQFIDVASTYAITGAKPTLFADGNYWSDHQPFWDHGYPAIMVVQDFDQFDPRNHTPEDTVSHFVWPYYVGATKVLLGAVASEAGLVATTSAPTVTSFTPASGPVGASVILTGTSLTGATAVMFNDASASYTVNSTTRITATVPAAATSGAITVTTLGGTALSAAMFKVKPWLSTLLPRAGRRGATVMLVGTGFGPMRGTSYVKFRTMKCGTYVSWSSTRILCRVPVRTAVGRAYVRVTTVGGTSTAKSFTVKR